MIDIIMQATLQAYAPQFYRTLHALSMVVLLSGVYLCWVFPLYTLVHLSGVMFMLYFHIKYDYCILTKLEKDAMIKNGVKPYKDGYYNHYLFRETLGMNVPEKFVTNMLIWTKVIPGLVPALYPIIKIVF